MIELTDEEYWAIVREDFYTFVERSFCELNPDVEFLPNWHIELIAAELEACRRGETKRLIINVPPRSLKSHCASVAFPAFLLGHNPSAQIICASYGQDLADKHALDCRALMNSGWYRRNFPTRLSKQALQELMTVQKGVRLATSVGGVLTGRGADFLIVDDATKPDEAVSDAQRNFVNQWFDNTLYSRLNDKRNGCIIIIMQRLHLDDLVGHVLEQGEWKVLSFPAIAEEPETHVIRTPYGTRTVGRKVGEALHPEREPLSVLSDLRKTLGEHNFAGQYQQQPAPLGGGMVKVGWLKRYASGQLPNKFEMIFQSWDTANKATELSDFSVCTTWGLRNKQLFLLDVFRKKLDYPDLKRAVRELATRFNATNVLVEDRASGTQLIQELRRDGMYGVTPYSSPMDKIMRLHSVTSIIENGFVHLPHEAPWCDTYIHELTTFSNGKYDDQVDSTSQALDWFKRRPVLGLIEYFKSLHGRDAEYVAVPPTACPECEGKAFGQYGKTYRCHACHHNWNLISARVGLRSFSVLPLLTR